jgi:hypothetical protein
LPVYRDKYSSSSSVIWFLEWRLKELWITLLTSKGLCYFHGAIVWFRSSLPTYVFPRRSRNRRLNGPISLLLRASTGAKPGSQDKDTPLVHPMRHRRQKRSDGRTAVDLAVPFWRVTDYCELRYVSHKPHEAV